MGMGLAVAKFLKIRLHKRLCNDILHEASGKVNRSPLKHARCDATKLIWCVARFAESSSEARRDANGHGDFDSRLIAPLSAAPNGGLLFPEV
jgi:hypothetical protein